MFTGGPGGGNQMAGGPAPGAGVVSAPSPAPGAGGYVPDPWGNMTGESLVLGSGQYDYGDFIHDHHRRHQHYFHDHHYIRGANETLDLSCPPQVQSQVIAAPPGSNVQFALRPDVMGKWAFENGAAQYGFGIGFGGPPQGAPPTGAPAGGAQIMAPPTQAPPPQTPQPPPMGAVPGFGGHRSITQDFQPQPGVGHSPHPQHSQHQQQHAGMGGAPSVGAGGAMSAGPVPQLVPLSLSVPNLRS